MYRQRRFAAIVVTTLIGAELTCTGAQAATEADPAGGWSEIGGAFVTPSPALLDSNAISGVPAKPAGSPKHTGKAEEKVINGTTHKRSHGWTTWTGKYHYTTAGLEHYWPASGVIATSGRKWGTNGTEAMTKYVAYNPNATSNGYGQARTYYGS